MTSEQDDANLTWQSPNDSEDDNDWDAAFGYDAVPPEQDMRMVDANALDEDDVAMYPDGRTTSFFNLESLRNFARLFSPVLVPLPFALLIFLISYAVSLRPQPLHLQILPLAILLLALAILQGTALYYAGSNEDLWLLCMISGYVLFLLVGAFAIFGPQAAIILLIVLLLIMAFFARRGFHAVSEGSVEIIYSFGKYTRTLFPGRKILWPWEKTFQSISIKERLWTCPVQTVKISRDQDVRLMATLSFQVVPEDAYLTFTVEKWEESLHTLFIGTLQAVVNQLSPADFVSWPQGHGTPLRSA
ncbi:MAG TPA: SPFH domain-containing protein, partial [Ktedonobacteraceae bacterium]|nr:SPFH domain-containing protein [Ktedonobacteraceae bacterium]